jgi:hypothetical protein
VSLSFLRQAGRAIAIAGLLLVAIPALAAKPSAADAENYIRKGNELRRLGRDQQALPMFQRAYDVAPSPRTAAQLGLCEIVLGYWMEADSHLTEAVAGHSEWIEKNRATLESSLRQVQKQIGEVFVTGSPTGATVSVNGRNVGTMPVPALRMPAGQVRVEVTAPGYRERTANVILVGESQERVMIHLTREDGGVDLARDAQPEARAQPAGGIGQVAVRPKREDSPSWGAGKIGGVVLMAVGAAAIAGGVVVLRAAHVDCNAPAEARCNQGDLSRVPGWSLIGAGAAVGILGGVMFGISGSNTGHTGQALVFSLRGAL